MTTISMPKSGCDFRAARSRRQTPTGQHSCQGSAACGGPRDQPGGHHGEAGLEEFGGLHGAGQREVQRRAPLVSKPITSVAAVSASAPRQPSRAKRRMPRGDSSETTTIDAAPRGRGRPPAWRGAGRARGADDALGDRRAGRQHHHVAEADQRQQRRQRPAVDGPPPTAEGGIVGAARSAIRRPSRAARPATSSRKRSPRASKPLNWSQLAQAGESSTTGAAPAKAAAAAAGTAASSVPAIACGTPCAASVAARAGASRPISTARAMRGKSGARLRCRPPWPCRRRSRRRGRS